MEAPCVWSLAVVRYFFGVKVSAGFTAALVPPHVLTEVLLPDHAAVHRPLVPHALVGQSSCGEESRLSVSRDDGIFTTR